MKNFLKGLNRFFLHFKMAAKNNTYYSNFYQIMTYRENLIDILHSFIILDKLEQLQNIVR